MATTQAPEDHVPHPADRKAVVPAQASALSQQQRAVSTANESAAAGIATRARAEIEVRALMAERHPRLMDQFRTRMLEACARPAFADAAIWERPVGSGKTTTGLSIRFAEECARNFTNLDIAVVVVSETDEHRVIEAVGVDMEVNVVHRVQAVIPKYVERLSPRPGDEILSSRQNSTGKMTYRIRANDDAMFTEHQKAAAKAKREVILFFIPADIKEECEEIIERTLALVDGDPEKFREKVLKAFARLTIDQAAIEKYLGGKVFAQATILELKMLQRAYNAINQGDTTWEELLAAKRGTKPEESAEGGEKKAPSKGAAGLRDVVTKKAAEAKPAEARAAASPDADSDEEIAREDREIARREGQGE